MLASVCESSGDKALELPGSVHSVALELPPTPRGSFVTYVVAEFGGARHATDPQRRGIGTEHTWILPLVFATLNLHLVS